MTYTKQCQDQLADSLFEFAQLGPEAADIDFGAGLLAAAVLWPVRQALRDGADEAIAAVRQIVGPNKIDLVQQAMWGWVDDPLEAAGGLSARATYGPRLQDGLTALRECFD